MKNKKVKEIEQRNERILSIAKSFCPKCLVQFAALGLNPDEVDECPVCKREAEQEDTAK